MKKIWSFYLASKKVVNQPPENYVARETGWIGRLCSMHYISCIENQHFISRPYLQKWRYSLTHELFNFILTFFSLIATENMARQKSIIDLVKDTVMRLFCGKVTFEIRGLYVRILLHPLFVWKSFSWVFKRGLILFSLK